MILNIIDTELKYFNCFCNAEAFETHIHFNDDNIKDMYSHNFTYVHEDINDEDFIQLISRELAHRKTDEKRYLRVITHKTISDDLLDRLLIKPEVDRYVYYGKRTDSFSDMKTKENARIEKAKDPQAIEHGRFIDVSANYLHMTMEFAIRRIDRKFMVYNDSNLPLDLYVCYDGLEPVGNCELLINNDTAKIEDFDILEMYQKKGFGSHVLRSLLEISHNRGVKYAYLVTDQEDTAKEMYIKNGFELAGGRTELMFFLK